MLRTIAVLLHRSDERFEAENYLLRLLIERWKSGGHCVDVVRGPDHFVPADLIIPHLDLTVTPQDYRQFLDRYPRAVNRRVTDTSKSGFSAQLLTRNDDYAGPVIVKTDRNYGGVPERRLEAHTRPSLASRIWRKALMPFRHRRREPTDAAAVAWEHLRSMKPGAYPVFPSLRDVPPGVFRNKHLVVEKFLPETVGDDFCLRYTYFLGDREISMLLRSKDRVIKGANSYRCEQVSTPPEIGAIRRQMGFDYGKFDYVIRDGQVILFDVNRTPAFAALERFQLTDTVVDHLAEGIGSIAG